MRGFIINCVIFEVCVFVSLVIFLLKVINLFEFVLFEIENCIFYLYK